ncbi:hypothetical protein [Dyella sp.]|uniref:hypothetical protein n=1 Tax=Dyella sp. TaxID=1869338 RepID=UPI002ED686FC
MREHALRPAGKGNKKAHEDAAHAIAFATVKTQPLASVLNNGISFPEQRIADSP